MKNTSIPRDISKMAAKDAEDWARAEMFYGEGAGIRRRHLTAEINDKYAIPGYLEAFNKAYESLNMNKFAEAAIRERKKLDRAAKAGKNIRALKSGNINGLSTGVFVVVGAVWVARQTGYDRKVEREMKKGWRWVKDEYATRKSGRRIRRQREAVYNVTTAAKKKENND